MATRLGGPVEIEVRLDTKKAQDQIKQLEGSLQKGQKQVEQIARTASATKPTAGDGAARSPGVSASSAGGPPRKRSITDTLLSAAKANALRGSAMSSPIGQAGAAAGRLIPEGAMGAAKFAGAVALSYAAVSKLAQTAPDLTFALARIAKLESDVAGLQATLEGFRRVFSTFESGIGALRPGYTQSTEYLKAALRLGADMPDMGEVFNESFDAEFYQRETDKKFESFKNREILSRGGENFKKFAERSIDAARKSFTGSLSR